MRLPSEDGARVTLCPTGYQFGRRSALRGDWDSNWLLVRGEARMSSGRTWSFLDPCLTTWEAVELLAWLRAAGQGQVAPIDAPEEDSGGLLTFTEPNLGFSVASVDDRDVLLRVHLSLESAPSQSEAELKQQGDLYAFGIPLTMTRANLLTAADGWRDDIASYPER